MTEDTAESWDVIDAALREDVGSGDWTSIFTVPPDLPGHARIIAKADGVVAGTDVARRVFLRVDPQLAVNIPVADGDAVVRGDVICVIDGAARSILTAERTALNFLQRLSGVATMTRRFADEVRGTSARILDTRKTTPGLRLLEKAAVLAGGGRNHRVGLFDMILIKENHIAAAGGITAAVARVREQNSASLGVEVEVRNMEEFDEALAARPDRILLDNMNLQAMREAVSRAKALSPRPELEASGNMSLERVADVARTGVDFISVGALTHSAPALDLSLLIES